ncbi:hypothetical protein GGR56DRAFT_628829 [Xylariaceae sp. FL0804]|nr:hypothetical protein GGR56DRAFT_628829 [Xylariaceae sp. FL0804]
MRPRSRTMWCFPFLACSHRLKTDATDCHGIFSAGGKPALEEDVSGPAQNLNNHPPPPPLISPGFLGRESRNSCVYFHPSQQALLQEARGTAGVLCVFSTRSRLIIIYFLGSDHFFRPFSFRRVYKPHPGSAAGVAVVVFLSSSELTPHLPHHLQYLSLMDPAFSLAFPHLLL